MLNFNLILRMSFLFALTGSLGSLYFSEVMKFPPCVLCWYQRAFMYPLVFVFGTGLWRNDKAVWTYALPLAFFGLLIAGYHNLLYYGFISEGLVPCQKDLSCTTRQLELFGFITIPLMSLAGFLMFNLFGLWSLYMKSLEKSEGVRDGQ
jgi:disulfide bond formation protein DsbB